MHTRTSAHVRTHAHIPQTTHTTHTTHTLIYTYTHTHAHTHNHTPHIHTHARTHTHTHTHTHTYTHTIHARTHVRACTDARTHTHNTPHARTHTHTHTYTHTLSMNGTAIAFMVSGVTWVVVAQLLRTWQWRRDNEGEPFMVWRWSCLNRIHLKCFDSTRIYMMVSLYYSEISYESYAIACYFATTGQMATLFDYKRENA